jgi:hypothetical protein
LYFYNIKILPDITQNDIKTTRENCKILKQIFLFFLNGPDQAQMHRLGRTWPNYMGWAGLLGAAQPTLAGYYA